MDFCAHYITIISSIGPVNSTAVVDLKSKLGLLPRRKQRQPIRSLIVPYAGREFNAGPNQKRREDPQVPCARNLVNYVDAMTRAANVLVIFPL